MRGATEDFERSYIYTGLKLHRAQCESFLKTRFEKLQKQGMATRPDFAVLLDLSCKAGTIGFCRHAVNCYARYEHIDQNIKMKANAIIEEWEHFRGFATRVADRRAISWLVQASVRNGTKTPNGIFLQDSKPSG